MNEDPRIDALVEVFLTGVKGLLEFYHFIQRFPQLYSSPRSKIVYVPPFDPQETKSIIRQIDVHMAGQVLSGRLMCKKHRSRPVKNAHHDQEKS